MALKVRQYREEMYRLRAHPSERPYGRYPNDFVDQRDSFSTVYLSIVPFLLLEYLLEVSTSREFPSGLVFPTGYLLFWAVYYSYYRPGFLEEKLMEPRKRGATVLPSILLGFAIWLVKEVVIARVQAAFRAVFLVRRVSSNRPPMSPRAGVRRAATERNDANSFSSAPRKASKGSLPLDILTALGVLGLGDSADWVTIHRRYRQLAKQFHPDLNPEVTQMGQRFMKVDAAYRKLVSVKAKYFS